MKLLQPGGCNALRACQQKRSLHHILAIALIFCGSLLFQSTSAQPFASDAEFVPGELVVQFKKGAAESQVLDAFQQAQMDVKRAILTSVMEREGHPGIDVVTTRLPVAQALRILSHHPAVAFAEPNWIYRRQAVANDAYYGSLWNLHGAYGINAPAAWDITTGSPGVAVGVVDQGLDPGHPDLASNIWLNPGDPTVNGVNEDNNWYWYTDLFFPITVRVDCTDDTHGWDFLNQNHTVYDRFDSPTDLSDGDDHGSHVAGIIGASGNTAIGVGGGNWDVCIVSSKCIGGGFGSLEDAGAALV
jgi:subtilisin family serine protease